MGKQPTQGQKKTKDQISKAASQRSKQTKKKWTKGRAKDKLNNAVFLDQASYKQIETQLPKMGALITVSTVSDKFKVNGSLARRCIRHFAKSGLLVPAGDQNSKQYIFTVNAQVVAAQKAAAAAAAADKPQAQKKAPAKK
ncbi:unnamed protein product [Paramecium octaurelia]|nr:unnamed protein product [Paramecium octaurelia]